MEDTSEATGIETVDAGTNGAIGTNGTHAGVFDGIAKVLAARARGSMRIVVVDVGDGAAAGGAARRAPTADLGDPALRIKFNLQGHFVIAEVAAAILDRENRAKLAVLQNVLSDDGMARGGAGDLAQWPDRIKHPGPNDGPNVRRFKRLADETRTQHYVNLPYDRRRRQSTLPDPIGDGHLLQALPSWCDKLKNERDPTERATALAFVLHLVGDLHQPLHCAALVDTELFPKGDDGGNSMRWGKDVDARHRAPNLHALWDDAVAARPADVAARIDELSRFRRADFPEELKLGTFEEWAAESYDLAKKAYDDFFDDADFAYLGPSEAKPGAQQFAGPSSEYRASARDIIRPRAALAAFRLADTLARCL